MTRPPISRRAWLVSAAAGLSCGRKRATGFAGYCFVADKATRSLTVVDLEQFRVRKAIPLDAAPSAVAAPFDPARPRVFALASEAGAVYEIDAAALAVKRKAWAGSQAIAMQLSPAGDALWVLYREPAVLAQLPLDSFRFTRRIGLPAPPESFALSEDGRAAVASRVRRSVSLISLSRGVIEGTLAGGVEPSLIRFRKDGRQLLAGSAPERCLAIFDVATGKTIVRLPLPVAPRHFAMTPDGGQLFISGDGADAVAIVFPYSTEIDQTILAGHAPGAMVVTDTSPSYLMVANPESSGITVLDMDMRKLVAVVRVGQGPGEILITPDNQYALAIDEQSADLAVVRLATFAEAAVRRYKSAALFTMISVGGKPVAAAIVRLQG
ncbi:MAG: hypothetical protein ABSC23_05120 [Bryobacteraceae bacterium]